MATNNWPDEIELRDNVPYIKGTDVSVGDLIDDSWANDGSGSAYTHLELVKMHNVTYEQISAARQFAINALSKSK